MIRFMESCSQRADTDLEEDMFIISVIIIMLAFKFVFRPVFGITWRITWALITLVLKIIFVSAVLMLIIFQLVAL